MADSYFQIATTPKLYVSYPLYQYASGALDEYGTLNGGVIDADMIKLLQIDPSSQVTIAPNTNEEFLSYKVVPSFDDETLVVESGLWNFDFCMLLGHNFNTQNIIPSFYSENTALNTSNIVNYGDGSVPE